MKFCEYFQMEILGVVDYYFGLIKGIGALSGAGWGSPLWACQPTDNLQRKLKNFVSVRNRLPPNVTIWIF